MYNILQTLNKCVRSYKYLKISNAQVISKDERKSINLSMSFKLINDNLHNFVFVLFNVKQCYDKAILFKYSGKNHVKMYLCLCKKNIQSFFNVDMYIQICSNHYPRGYRCAQWGWGLG